MRRTCGSARKSLSSWPARALFCRPAAAGVPTGHRQWGRARTGRVEGRVGKKVSHRARALARREAERREQVELSFGASRARLHAPRTTASGGGGCLSPSGQDLQGCRKVVVFTRQAQGWDARGVGWREVGCASYAGWAAVPRLWSPLTWSSVALATLAVLISG